MNKFTLWQEIEIHYILTPTATTELCRHAMTIIWGEYGRWWSLKTFRRHSWPSTDWHIGYLYAKRLKWPCGLRRSTKYLDQDRALAVCTRFTRVWSDCTMAKVTRFHFISQVLKFKWNVGCWIERAYPIGSEVMVRLHMQYKVTIHIIEWCTNTAKVDWLGFTCRNAC